MMTVIYDDSDFSQSLAESTRAAMCAATRNHEASASRLVATGLASLQILAVWHCGWVFLRLVNLSSSRIVIAGAALEEGLTGTRG